MTYPNTSFKPYKDGLKVLIWVSANEVATAELNLPVAGRPQGTYLHRSSSESE